MSKLDMGSIFHIKKQWNILVIGNYYVNYQNFQNSILLTSLDTKKNTAWCIYSCLQIPPRENWFQYIRRVHATAINFPCIITLSTPMFLLMEFKVQSIKNKLKDFLNSYIFWDSLYKRYIKDKTSLSKQTSTYLLINDGLMELRPTEMREGRGGREGRA